LSISSSGPVGNLVYILENNGFLIYIHAFDERQFSGINGMVGKRPYIALNGNMNAERQRFTIVHELAHLFFIWPNDMSSVDCEKRSNAIAGAFLIPQADAKRELGMKRSAIQNDMCLTAEEFGISMLCLAFRAKELKIVSESAYKDFLIKAAKLGWQKNEPSRIQKEESSLFRQLVYRAVAEGEINVQKGAELLQVSYDDVRSACLGEDNV
jgi:Zn-dependent peptidase ImmA (M78 family)